MKVTIYKHPDPNRFQMYLSAEAIKALDTKDVVVYVHSDVSFTFSSESYCRTRETIMRFPGQLSIGISHQKVNGSSDNLMIIICTIHIA